MAVRALRLLVLNGSAHLRPMLHTHTITHTRACTHTHKLDLSARDAGGGLDIRGLTEENRLYFR